MQLPERFSVVLVPPDMPARYVENVQLPKVHGRSLPDGEHSAARAALGQTDTLVKSTATKTVGVTPTHALRFIADSAGGIQAGPRMNGKRPQTSGVSRRS